MVNPVWIVRGDMDRGHPLKPVGKIFRVMPVQIPDSNVILHFLISTSVVNSAPLRVKALIQFARFGLKIGLQRVIRDGQRKSTCLKA